MANQIFVNLPVKDVAATRAFFSKLGFGFNEQFSDDNAVCMIVSDSAFVMLLAEPFYKTFTTRPLWKAEAGNEALIALSCPSREAVDAMVHAAIEAGGSHAMDANDHGFMYGWSFYDINGHHWEVVWMDPEHIG